MGCILRDDTDITPFGIDTFSFQMRGSLRYWYPGASKNNAYFLQKNMMSVTSSPFYAGTDISPFLNKTMFWHGICDVINLCVQLLF